VQRVLRHLAEEWPDGRVEARYGYLEGRRFVTGPISALGSAIASLFRVPSSSSATASEIVRSTLAGAAEQSFSTREVERFADGYLLPEPNMHPASLAVAERLRGCTRTIPFFIYYDALPLTQPSLFPAHADRGLGVTRYHHTLAAADNIAFISRAVREDFESRIARRKLPNAIVARPGGDALRRLEHVPSPSPTFVAIGTVEPRKRHGLMLDAFEQLWAAGRDYRLVVLGTAGGSEQRNVIDRLRHLSATPRVVWVEQAGDELVTSELAQAAGMLFPGEEEGYGLPPVEALAVGCPVIVAENLPALEDLPSDGQLRIRTVSVEALVAAIETLADPISNTAHRRAIGNLRLPTWRQFAEDVCGWIREELGRAGARAG
jgi:glycosyltransferase involved in cell wall biosynthesis